MTGSRILGDSTRQILFVIGLTGLGMALFAAAMTEYVNYDEEQYVAGAYFASTLSIYRDFISFQPPVSTWIFSAALHVASPWYFLAARVVTWTLSFGASLLLVSLLLSAGTGRLAAFALVLAFVASPFTEVPLATARNDIMSLFFFLLGLRFFFGRRWEIARGLGRQWAAGFFVALAACTKYTYAFAAPVLAVAVLLDSYGARKQSERLLSIVPALWFLAGAGAGVLPVLYELLVNFRNFVFSTLVFHATAPFDWYRDQGIGEALSLRYKLRAAVLWSMSGGNATLLIVATGSAIAILLRHGGGLFGRGRWPSRPVVTLLAALFGAGCILAFVPTPSHAMYFAPVAALGTLCAGMLYSTARPEIPRRLAPGLLALALLPNGSAFAHYSELLARSTDMREWTGVKVHRSAMAIADLITKDGAQGLVATLFPITILDTSAVRPEFASGPFFFRSADAYSAEQIAQWRGVGPKTLDTLLAASPPAAVVGGFLLRKWSPRMDQPLIEYAKRNGYRLVAEGLGIPGYAGGEVWVRVPQAPHEPSQ